MFVSILKSKIHRATITECDLNYIGSLTIDSDLIDAAGLYVYEKIQVVNINTGIRFDTYVIEGERGSGEVCLNGAAARLGAVDDRIIIMAFADIEAEKASNFVPRNIMVDKNNKIISTDQKLMRNTRFESVK